MAGDLNLSIRESYPGLVRTGRDRLGARGQHRPGERLNLFIQSRRQTRLKVIDRCGLLPHVEQPDEFLAYARKMLAPVAVEQPSETEGRGPDSGEPAVGLPANVASDEHEERQGHPEQ